MVEKILDGMVMTRIKNGWLQGVEHKLSTNFNKRPANTAISLLVIHSISLPPGEFGGSYIEDLFLNGLDHNQHPYFQTLKGMKVSAHCLIQRDGKPIQFVNFADRAWHAGQSSFQGQADCNNFSIGIEMEGTDTEPYTESQYQQLVHLSDLIMNNYPLITLDRITGHEHISPGRKSDPGASFDWQYFFNLLKNRM